MNSDDHLHDLEQQLRIERIEREAAQERSSTLSENAATWRQRAEERRERITRLEAERDELRTFPGWLRAALGRRRRRNAAVDGAPQSGTGPALSRPRQRSTRIRPFASVSVVTVGVVDPMLRLILAETDVSDLGSGATRLDRADLVVVEDPTALDDESAEMFERWASAPGRPPIAWIGVRTADPRDITVSRDWRTGDSVGLALAPAFALGTRPDEVAAADAPFDPTDPENVELAARGLLGPAGDGFEQRRIRARSKRRAYREHAPWVVASRLLVAAGVDVRGAWPPVAGILVSNRPHLVVEAMEQFFRQDYQALELVVACHGIDVAPVRAAANTAPDDLLVTVLELPADRPLGACINEAIEHSTAGIIAKIDDDDHYGSGYLQDAVNAMYHAEADLVGKGACLTFVEAENRTVLRRPDIRERFYEGSPSGGSLVFRRSVWEQTPFAPRTVGEDAAFIKAARAAGTIPYATEPFEYVYVRSAGGNTWAAIDEVFTKNAVEMWEGFGPENADVDR